MRLATIDVGTNTALLLISEVGTGGTVTSLHEERRFVRLGAGVDATGRVNRAAMERLRAALLAYREVAAAWNVDRIVVGATSASRDARNQPELIDFVRRETGLDYTIISGEEEAALSFAGATSALAGLDRRCAVIDIGGGSTELVIGPEQTLDLDALEYRRSLNVGSVRITERFFDAQPPVPAAIVRAERFVLDALDAARPPLDASIPFVGAAGTLVVLMLADRQAQSWADVGEATPTMPYAQVRRWRERLLAMTYDEVLALNPEVMAGRADVFPAGVLILECVMRWGGLHAVHVSPRGLRHGIALRAVKNGLAGSAGEEQSS